ncbi:non-ribosomal peptide synthetase [Brevibacillus laterosporus]|uniref:non-ribosomal peptide synthetase n=1 Tax=Brevibacillus laterosporus TaxID=1465 RepID=UPI000BD843E6|nr:non-ribosomal peptide synthetase [Brevibacillus laterosporus]PCN44848.1 non-ribosomal peptide synthetase [Brevibacillus laterosporus]
MNKDLLQLFSLTHPQQRIWYSELLYPNTGVSSISLTIKMKGNISLGALQQALNMIIFRHDAFRIKLTAQNGYPQQYVEEYSEKSFECFDFSGVDGEAQALKWLDQHNRTPFELLHSELYQFIICKISDQEYWYNVKIHHIICDGISARMFINQVNEYYSQIANDELPEITENHTYFDFIQTEQDYEKSDRYQKDKSYWVDKFSTLPEVIGFKSYNPLTLSTAGKRKNIILEERLYYNLYEFCKQTNSSMLTIFMTALYIYLHKKTTQNDVSIGTFYANKTTKKEKEMLGMFVSTVPTRVFVDPEMDLLSLLKVVSKEQVSILRHQRFPYNQMMEDLREAHQYKDLQRLFGVSVQYRAMNYSQYENVEIEVDENFCGDVINDFEMNVIELDNQKILFQLNYRAQLFTEMEMEQLIQQFFTIIETIIHHPTSKIADISLLREEEKNMIISEFNNTVMEYPREKLIHQLFEEQAARIPDQIAVICEGEQLSYRELNERANQLARKLRAEGVVADQLVGIMAERSLEMMIGIFGILKAGGAYMPIDPEFPEERIRYMLEDSKAKLLLGQNHLLERVTFAGKVVDINDAQSYHQDGSNLKAINGPNHLAYVIYTSGSTGKPKGVMIEHHSVINRLMWMHAKYPISSADTIMQKTAITFDVSVWELFWWSMVGSKMCLLSVGGEKNPEQILETIAEHRITTMHFVPAMLHAFLDYVEQQSPEIVKEKLKSLRQVFASGEALPPQHVDRFRRAVSSVCEARLINLYGPTEATVDVTYFDCDTDEELATIPIGKPIYNTQLYIVQANSENLQPIGIAGELCIAGVGLARGYLNRPELTQEKFVKNPFVAGERMYRTGDLARWLPDGNIEYLGRIDDQVKIRGVRIELGEIESQLRKLDGLREVVVVAKEDQAKEKFLCAYMVTDREVSTAEIRAHLAAKLPIAMIPSTFISLEAMPLTANGKINKRSLPDPDNSLLNTEYVAPRTQLEVQLATVWQQVLGIDRVGCKDDFFALGGHSLRAMMVISQMHKEYQMDIPLRVLFEKPTIEEIAQYLESERTKQIISIRPATKQDYYPVSAAQRRMFILNQFDGIDISYNMPSIMLLEGKLDLVKLETAFKGLINRHESLRTSFELVNGSPVQKIHSVVDFEVDYQVTVEEELEEIIDEFIKPFQLNMAPLLRVKLVQTRLDRYLLLVDTHHIISDGVSSGIIISELVELYQGNTLPELTIQYKDFSEWQHEQSQTDLYKKQEDHWVQTFADEIPVLNLPTDFPRPNTQSFDGDVITRGTGKELMEGLYKIAADTGTTLYMVLLAAYNVLLSKYSGQEDLIVGTPVTGRSHVDLQSTVGMFVNTLAMRNKPARSKSFREFLIEVKRNALQAYENQDYPFEELVEKLELQSDVSRNPMFDTMFTLQNRGEDSIELDELRFITYEGENKWKHSKFDITFIATEERDQIMIGVEYCTKLYRQETIERLTTNFLQIIKAIVDNPEVKLATIEILTNAEKNQLLQEFNNTERNYQQDTTIHQLFEEQVRKTPDQVALIWNKKELTYQELNERANQLARTLRNKGIVPNQLVAIMVDRSVEMIVGIMGILKAGAAYVPIDPAYPTERIEYVLEDSGAVLLLTQSHLFNGLAVNMVRLDLDEEQNYVVDGTNLTVVNQPTDLAYVIYTSGTTGKPKGVMIEHHSIVNCLQWRRDEYAFNPKDKALQIFSFAFDGFVASLFAPMLGGATSILPREEEAKDPFALRKLIASESITHYYGVPSLFNAIVDSATAEDLHQLRCVTLGGEKLSPQIVQKIKQKNPAIEINNEYGPTENSVVTTIQRAIGVDQAITIGRPLANVTVYIVNNEHHLQPIGVVGELCIAGRGLGRGYLNRPELTEEKFVANPFVPGERMYKTGDLAKWRPDGTIEYVGRVDEQVKVRGFRIEIGEIESTILQYHGVGEVVVTAQQDQHAQQYLCAYFVAEKEVVLADLRKFVSKELPAYMVPTYFVQLLELPTTANGKVDKRALPKPQNVGVAAKEYIAPRNMVEEQLATIWQEVLEVEKIGITDHFFEIGGHSLKAMLLISKVYEYMQEELPLHLVFQHPTIEKMAEFILHKQYEQNAGHPILLNKETNRPVFSFTPIAAHSTFYQKLAEEVHDISLYSFDFIEEDNRIEQYVNAITQIDSEGPYTLMGYSSGGNLAFEVAKVLENQGRQVSSIILFDSYWKDKAIEQTATEARKEIGAYFKKIAENNELFNMKKEDLELFITNDFIKQSFFQNMFSYLMFHNQLVNKGNVKAAIHLIQAECEQGNVTAYEAEKWNEKVWARASERFINYRGYGDHPRMLSGEQVTKNGSILKEILEASFALK